MIQVIDTPEAKSKAEKIAKQIYMELLREGRYVHLNTSGSSMYPFLKGCDMLKITPLKESDIKIGNVVAVDNEGRTDGWFYVHRVIGIFKRGKKKIYITKGDANREGIDEPVGFERIVGKLVEIDRSGLKINYESALWEKYLNKRIAEISTRHGRKLRTFAPYIRLILEWRRFLSNLRRGVGRLDEPLCNAAELILLLCRTTLDENSADKAKEILRKGIDWEFFMESATRSGLSFVFYNALTRLNYKALVPEGFTDSLKIAYLYAVHKITPQYRETLEILKAFSEKEIPAIPLKGPILAKRLYGEIAARGLSVDIDLLIKEEDKKIAARTLEEAGYSFVPGTGVWERLGQYVYRKNNGHTIDLHWTLSPVSSNAERMKEFWEGTRIAEDSGVRYHELREEELLLQLAAHFVDSAFLLQLRYVSDINELLTKYEGTLDWGLVLEKAKKCKLRGSLYAGLLLTRALFNSKMPSATLEKLKPGFAKRFLIKLLANRKVLLHRDSRRRRLIERFLKYVLFQVLEAESPRDYFAVFGRIPSGISKVTKDL